MHDGRRRRSWPAIILGTASLATTLAASAANPPEDDHQQAVAALANVKAAVATLVAADASYATDRSVYYRAAQRAINALTGEGREGYVAEPGTPGDAAGAIGHIDALLDRAETPVWATALHSAEANVRAAVAHLHDSLRARELIDFQVAASRALAYLEVARGRPTETGVFGGLEGALATTVLGVPAGAPQQDACTEPSSAPAYGTHGGYLAWVAVPASDGSHALAEDPGATELFVRSGTIVLHTAAAKLVAGACVTRAATVPMQGVPALYTKAQAEAGKQIFSSKCVACHGANLQGTAAPSVAGTDFLTTAQHNGWTLAVIRTIVFTLMPLNSPASLSPAEGADVMAYLLASNCYPAGTTPFPAKEDASFANVLLGPMPGRHDGENEAGVCKVE